MPQSPRTCWSIAQYESLFSMGLLEDGRYELLDGDVVAKVPKTYAHATAQSATLFLLTRLFGQDQVLLPVSIVIGDDSMPDPDVIVATKPINACAKQDYLQPGDVRVVVEVSDATIDDDLTRKAGIYARGGIAEYWVLDVSGRRLLVHGSPTETGYTHIVQYDEAYTAAPLALPTATFLVAELLP